MTALALRALFALACGVTFWWAGLCGVAARPWLLAAFVAAAAMAGDPLVHALSRVDGDSVGILCGR
jgi:hypothetical protein